MMANLLMKCIVFCFDIDSSISLILEVFNIILDQVQERTGLAGQKTIYIIARSHLDVVES